MIVFQAQGGLGNQLFQYAAARRLALQHQVPLVLDAHWFSHPRPGETPRPLELDHYAVSLQKASVRQQRGWAVYRSRWARWLSLAPAVLPLRLLREQGFGLNANLLQAGDGVYLSGFWQSEGYFADIRSTLLAELQPVAAPGAQDQQLLAQMHGLQAERRAVCLHVRRGDYVSLASASSYHGVCSLAYYQKAMAYVAERVRQPHFFVFSDDPQWTRTHLQTPFATTYVDHNPSALAFQDLRLMTHCQHHILANSSFSWWGAWLAPAGDGIVVAPAQWYAAPRPTPDLLPAAWVRLEA